METCLKVTGGLFIALSLLHIGFPKYFNWKSELKSLSLMNKQMMYVHSFFIAFTVMMMGVLCISSSDLLIHSELGKRVSFGFSIFWFIRFCFQLFIYSSKLWRGKLFETFIHIVFTMFWLYLCILFFIVYWIEF